MIKKFNKRASALQSLLWLMLLALVPAHLTARDFEFAYKGQTLAYTVIDESAKTVMTKPCVKSVAGNNVVGDLEIPSEVSDGTNTYKVTAIGEGGFKYCEDLTSVVIPSSVTTIEEDAFMVCSKLKSIDIPNSVTTIGKYAFSNCSSLSSITLSESLTKIGDNAFCWDEKLRSITIPASVKELSYNIFANCLSLREIKFEGNTIPETKYDTFTYMPPFTQIVVPTDMVDAWKEHFANNSRTQHTITDKYTPVKKTITGVKPTPVDMGLSVKWADVDLGSATKTTSGKHLKLSDQDMEAYLGEGWRVPTKSDFEELFENCVAQVYLNQAGVPSKVVYTSKKNGAKITFYYPKTAFIKNGEKFVNPQNNTYQTMYACHDTNVMLSMAAKLPEQVRKPIEDYVAAAKVNSMNIADWPDEMLQWLKSNLDGINLDSKFIYGSKDDFVEDVDINIFDCFFRPVYVADESSDED